MLISLERENEHVLSNRLKINFSKNESKSLAVKKVTEIGYKKNNKKKHLNVSKETESLKLSSEQKFKTFKSDIQLREINSK